MNYINNDSTRVNATISFPFGTLSWITWIVFMILYYGTGTIADWPVFWIWFPFWLPFAVFGVELIFVLIIAGIIALLDR